MNLLAVVTPPYIYHGCSIQKTFFGGKFAHGEFIDVNMKNCVRRNVRKQREIKNGEKYIALKISLKFGSLDKMEITSSEQKDYLGRSGKGLITSLGIETIGRSNKNKNSRYAINNVIMKYLSKIVKEFESLPYKGYVRNLPKHETTNNYFIYQESLLSVLWELMPSIFMLNL